MTAFEVIPAIDILGGRCVRLFQGDYDQETTYSEDPVATARQWQELGAPRIHVVDLDGAREGHPVNVEQVQAICAAVGIPVEVSGGLRSLEDIERTFERGAERVQLGSIAVSQPSVVAQAVQRFPQAVVVSIDARGGEVMTRGWLDSSGRKALDFAREMIILGVPRLMVTDIGRDGAMTGPNLDLYRDFVDELSVPVIASGGVASIDDLVRLAETGCEGAIVGKALYEGAFDLAEAIAATRSVRGTNGTAGG